MLYDEIIYAIENETAIEQKVFEHEQISKTNAKKITFQRIQFLKCRLPDNDFEGADFFKTKLKGIDLSDCMISGLMVSDTYAELAGVKVNIYQAAELAKLLKIQIV